MAKKMSDKAASGWCSDAAVKEEGTNHHHHHPCFIDHQHKAAPASAPAGMLECAADIDDCADAFIKHFHQQLEMQRLQSMNHQIKHMKEVLIGSRRP